MRQYALKLYPNVAQAEALARHLRLYAALYNALLEARIHHWWHPVWSQDAAGVWCCKRHLTYFDQCKGLTALRNDPAIGAEWAALSSGAMRAIAQRVDWAWKAGRRRAALLPMARACEGVGPCPSGGNAADWEWACHIVSRKLKKDEGRYTNARGNPRWMPRFKRAEDFPGWAFKAHGSGWKLDLEPRRKNGRQNGRLYIKGLPGLIKVRGRLPDVPEKIKIGSILHRGGDWWLSLVVILPDCQRPMGRAEGTVRLNLIDEFARVSRADGGCDAGQEDVAERVFVMADGRITLRNQGGCTEAGAAAPETGGDRRKKMRVPKVALGAAAPDLGGDRRGGGNDDPDFIGAATPETGKIASLQQRMARCKRGSAKYRKLRRMKARAEARAARIRRDSLHNWTTELANEFGKLAIVKPASIKAATASGKGNEQDRGAQVETKAAVNRRILDQAPATAIQMLEYKLAERGGLTEIRVDADAPADLGNAVVAAAKANRKLKRSIKRASRPSELHRDR